MEIANYNDDSETYSTAQTSKLLGVSRFAVANLDAACLIERIVYLKGKRDTIHFTRESVNRLIQLREKHVTISDLEKKWRLPRTTINDFAVQNGINFFEDPSIYLKKTRILKVEGARLLKPFILEYLNRSAVNPNNKRDFVIDGYGLYQSFLDREGNIHRLIEKKGVWPKVYGFETEQGFVTLSNAISDKWYTVYSLKDHATMKGDYVELNFNEQSDIGLKLIDYFYQAIGIKNMHIKVDDGSIKLFVRKGSYSLEEMFATDLLKALNNEIIAVDAHLSVENATLTVASNSTILCVNLNRKSIDFINEYAKKEALSKSDALDKIIEGFKKISGI